METREYTPEITQFLLTCLLVRTVPARMFLTFSLFAAAMKAARVADPDPHGFALI
jgi:hypothetical protein